MNKLLLLLTTGCLSVFHSFSQQHPSISLSLGASFPVGEFANKDGNDAASGLAKAGGVADLSFTLPFHDPHFGFIGTVRAKFNPISTDAAMAPFKEAFSSFDWTSTKKSWKAGAVMVGVYYELPVAKRLSIREELEAGVAEAELPSLKMTGLRDSSATGGGTDLIQVTNNKKNATTFTALVKTGISYRLTNRVSLRVSLGYWYLEPTFNKASETIAVANNLAIPGYYSLSNATSLSVSSVTRNYTQNMSTLDLTAGLSLRL